MKTPILILAVLIQAVTINAQVAGPEVEANASMADRLAISVTIEGADPDPAAVHTAGIDPSLIRSEEGLVIWPVPTGSELNIFCTSETSGNLPFEIVDMTGRTILRGSIHGEEPNVIEVDNLKQGDHLLRVVDGSGVRSVAFSRIAH